MHDIGLFIVSGILLNIAPGPDSLLVMSRSASGGWRSGSAASLGIGAGTFVHVLAAALGLSAFLAASSAAFAVVKYVGAAYLVYIGISMLLSRQKRADLAEPNPQPAQSLRRTFAQGFLTNALNPKVAIFFLAFVPQFIDAQSPNKALSFILLGLIFNFNSMIWLHVLALFSSAASKRIRVSAAVSRWLNRSIGAMFVLLGLRLAFAQKS